MYQDTVQKFAENAQSKMTLLKKKPLAYFVASILAGAFIGFGICLVFTIQGLMPSCEGTKVIMGFCFSVALSLVVISGGELFTGNNLVMSIGVLRKSVALSDTLKLWAFCWIGNLLGSVLLAYLFVHSGLTDGAAADVFTGAAIAKTELPFTALLIRGILCNTLVCLAVWGTSRINDGAGKILLITLCIASFIISGYEHSVANMTLLAIGLFAPSSLTLTISAAAYNLAVVTLGNMIGGIVCVALPYWFISQTKK